jgi:hypothetical protein
MKGAIEVAVIAFLSRVSETFNTLPSPERREIAEGLDAERFKLVDKRLDIRVDQRFKTQMVVADNVVAVVAVDEPDPGVFSVLRKADTILVHLEQLAHHFGDHARVFNKVAFLAIVHNADFVAFNDRGLN